MVKSPAETARPGVSFANWTAAVAPVPSGSYIRLPLAELSMMRSSASYAAAPAKKAAAAKLP
jgi:hypothetical protein